LSTSSGVRADATWRAERKACREERAEVRILRSERMRWVLAERH
jgi:hypothetical protein